MKKAQLTAILLTAALIPAAPVSAEEEQITPECQTELVYHVGTLDVHFDQNLIGGDLSVCRIQPEGEFPYYTYHIGFVQESVLHCLLIEGDYILKLELPDADSTDSVSYLLPFTIQDPDMDEMQLFCETYLDIWLSNDADAVSDELVTMEPALENQIIQEGQRLTLARRNFAAGDLLQDGIVDAADAAELLKEAVNTGAGIPSELTAMQNVEADLNADGRVDAADASVILCYAADCAVGNFSGDLVSYIISKM